MTFNSITFLFYFFPPAVLLTYLLPLPVKNIGLIVLSLVFYAFGSPMHMLLLLFSIGFNYFCCKEIERLKSREKTAAARSVLALGIGFDVLVLAVFKYTHLGLPMGISFYTFSVISSLVDVFRRQEKGDLSPVSYALYVLLFTKISSGPIVAYEDFCKAASKPSLNLSAVANGWELFMVGLFKKVLLADRLAAAFAQTTSGSTMASGTAFLGMLFYSLQLYFDFSGYSDMAIGLSRMLGFRFEKNFDHPYLSDGVSEFWRRWHISLGAWFRNYVYIPLGGNRVSAGRQVLNLAVVWVLTGLWHGSTWNFLLWGLYHLFFILLERFVLKDLLSYIPKPIRILFTALVACFGWIFFFTPNLTEAFHYVRQIFGGDHLGFYNQATMYYLKSNLLLLAASLVLVGPWVHKAANRLRYSEKPLLSWSAILSYGLLFFFCLMFIVGSSYTSFLYSNF